MFNHKLITRLYNPDTHTIEVPTREEIEEQYKWNLTDIYSSDEEWEIDFKFVEESIIGYAQFEGRITDSSVTLLACLKFDEEIGMKLERLYLYCMLAKDSDMRNTKYQGMDDRIKQIYSKVLTASSFIKPELLKTDEEKLRVTLKEFHQALVNRNTVSVNQQTDKALSYGHSNGWVETKAEMIRNLETGYISYQGFKEDSITVAMNGNLASVRFVADITATMKGTASVYHLKVLEVWVKKGKRWVLFARQAVKN